MRWPDGERCQEETGRRDSTVQRLQDGLRPFLREFHDWPLDSFTRDEAVTWTRPKGAPGTEVEIASKLDSATKRFRTRDASLDDRRAAVRDLADVLESLRDDLKDSMLSKDERELFHIANGFAIRHQNRHQHSDTTR